MDHRNPGSSLSANQNVDNWQNSPPGTLAGMFNFQLAGQNNLISSYKLTNSEALSLLNYVDNGQESRHKSFVSY